MNVILFNQTTNEKHKFSTSDVNPVLQTLKKLHIPIEQFHQMEEMVINTIKTFCEPAEFTDNEADMSLIINDMMPTMHVLTKDDVEIIFLGEIVGNCVDKFLAYHMNTFTARIRMLSNRIEQNTGQRMQTNEYHDTNTFEQDYANLTRIRETCDRLSEAIRKFQENITLGYK